jgi:hypothetical protein
MDPPNGGTVSPKLPLKAEEGSVPKSLADSDTEKGLLVVDEAADSATEGIPAKEPGGPYQGRLLSTVADHLLLVKL